ncbi:MAG: hypothetical protein HQL34_13620, partial [Alphaproteobacteria bacterium]|nr:hypothetical protein [Alphaproteobacteria bacterium]
MAGSVSGSLVCVGQHGQSRAAVERRFGDLTRPSLTVLARLAARRPGTERLLADALRRAGAEAGGLVASIAQEVGDPIGRLYAEHV